MTQNLILPDVTGLKIQIGKTVFIPFLSKAINYIFKSEIANFLLTKFNMDF
jgi:hypothetical protein